METLKEMQKKTESNTTTSTRKYINIKDGESVKFRIRQELAEDGKNFNKDRGTASLVGVHKHPRDFKKTMACTMESEGRCWACEQMTLDPENKGKWKPQNHLLVNVGVQDEDGTWSNQILDQGFSKSHVGNDLIEFVLENKTATEAVFKFKRSGSKTETEYFLVPVGVCDSKEPKDLAAIPLEDLNGARYRVVGYDDQEKYMTEGISEESSGDAGGW